MTRKYEKVSIYWKIRELRRLEHWIEGYGMHDHPEWAREMRTESRMVAWKAWLAGRLEQPTDDGMVDLSQVE